MSYAPALCFSNTLYLQTLDLKNLYKQILISLLLMLAQQLLGLDLNLNITVAQSFLLSKLINLTVAHDVSIFPMFPRISISDLSHTQEADGE